MMVEYATVQLRRPTKERLAALRRGNESFDELVQRIIEAAVRQEEAEFLTELDAMYADDAAFKPLE